MSPKHPDWWAFPADAGTGAFTGSVRGVFEQVKDDPSIHKIILTRDEDVSVDGVNVEVVPLESPLGQHRLMRSGTILITRDGAVDVVHPVASELHNLIHVRETATLQKIGFAATRRPRALDEITREQAPYRAVISSSKVDTLAMTAAFYPLTFHQIWNTGLPRNDFILRDEDQLPADYRTELDKLRTLVGDRRLVLFMPTFRNAQSEGYYRFSPDEIAWLDTWLQTNNCVLGVREHMADSARLYNAQLAGLPVLDLSDTEFAHVEMLYRASAALITDYSSAFIDYLLTGKPTVSFAWDDESYLPRSRRVLRPRARLPRTHLPHLRRAPNRPRLAAPDPTRRVLRVQEETVLRPRRRPEAPPASSRGSATSTPCTASGSGRTSTSPDTSRRQIADAPDRVGPRDRGLPPAQGGHHIASWYLHDLSRWPADGSPTSGPPAEDRSCTRIEMSPNQVVTRRHRRSVHGPPRSGTRWLPCRTPAPR